MEQQITKISLLLMCIISSGLSGKECPPKSLKPEPLSSEEADRHHMVNYCYGRYFCSGIKCPNCYYKPNSEKKTEYIFLSAISISTGKLEEAKGEIKITGCGQYRGLPCDSEFFHLGTTKDYSIQFACIPDKKGEMQEASWICMREGGNMSESALTKVKETLKKNGLEFDKYEKINNKECKKMY